MNLKRMKFTLVFFCILSCSFLQAQASQLIMEEIAKNDLSLSEDKLSTWVILSINNDSATLRKTDALKRLSSYLTTIQPTGYKTRHSGKADDKRLIYTVANLSSIAGQHRLFVFTEDENGRVKEIRLSAI